MNEIAKSIIQNPLVSIIIAAFNEEEFVEACIQSCLGQDYENIQIVVADDGSTDRTVEVLERMGAAEPRLVVLRHPKNLGKVSAFNSAFASCTGEFVALMGADDVCYASRIRRQMEVVRNSGAVAVTSDLDVIDAQGRLVERGLAEKQFRVKCGDTYDFRQLAIAPKVFGGTLLFSKVVGDKIFPLPAALPSEDWWLPFRLALLGKVVHLGISTIGYRLHARNSSLRGQRGAKAARSRSLRSARYFDEVYRFLTTGRDLDSHQSDPHLVAEVDLRRRRHRMLAEELPSRRATEFLRNLGSMSFGAWLRLAPALLPVSVYLQIGDAIKSLRSAGKRPG